MLQCLVINVVCWHKDAGSGVTRLLGPPISSLMRKALRPGERRET